jgi:hypothetical protein
MLNKADSSTCERQLLRANQSSSFGSFPFPFAFAFPFLYLYHSVDSLLDLAGLVFFK